MTEKLDQTLIFRVRRKAGANQLTAEQCIAINLLNRQGVSGTILAKVFGVSKNTIYYRCISGAAKSYRTSTKYNIANEVKKVIAEMGEDVAWDLFVTDEMVQRANQWMKIKLNRGRHDRR